MKKVFDFILLPRHFTLWHYAYPLISSVFHLTFVSYLNSGTANEGKRKDRDWTVDNNYWTLTHKDARYMKLNGIYKQQHDRFKHRSIAHKRLWINHRRLLYVYWVIIQFNIRKKQYKEETREKCHICIYGGI